MDVPPVQRRVLVVEDDPKIADMLANYLQSQGFATQVCGDGLQAEAQLRTSLPDVLLLDLMLPGQDGLAVCRAVRGFSDIPILMLTARVDEVDRLLGLDSGADDYVCKPFSPREVVARVRALLRRSDGRLLAQPAARLCIDASAQCVRWDGRALALTPVEYRLLQRLMERPGQVFSRAKLLDHVHMDMRDVSDRAIDSHIKNLRRKMDAAAVTGVAVASVYGVGYRLDVD